jgi:predicted short-subunit dehydrogenase-like oxidoreductase (DUF2520 family)
LIRRLYDAKAVSDLDFANSRSNWFIITAPDQAIENICKEIILPENSALIHTSGSTSLETMMYAAASSYGVLYPFQTFTKGSQTDLSKVPILIEASNKGLDKSLMKLAKKISKRVIRSNSNQRKRLHLAGIFASNFTNHMLTLAEDIATKSGFPKDIVYPLIIETINKAMQIGASEAQTGPARRGDLNTIENHQILLENELNTSEIYKVLTRSIQDKYHE